MEFLKFDSLENFREESSIVYAVNFCSHSLGQTCPELCLTGKQKTCTILVCKRMIGMGLLYISFPFSRMDHLLDHTHSIA